MKLPPVLKDLQVSDKKGDGAKCLRSRHLLLTYGWKVYRYVFGNRVGIPCREGPSNFSDLAITFFSQCHIHQLETLGFLSYRSWFLKALVIGIDKELSSSW